MDTVLELLAEGGYISGERIAAALGITRAAVWKRIRSLRAEGWQIESGGKRGYRLVEEDSLRPEFWQKQLHTKVLGKANVVWAPEMDSTNTQAKILAVSGAPSGSLCLCEAQTAGRGRLGRTWVSRPGVGLWQSLLIRPALAPAQAPLITFVTAIAMAEAVEETTGLSIGIKWPNDLVCGGRKIAGILLEAAADPDRVEWVVAGIGLNVHPGAVPPELSAQACCIADHAPPPLRREILIRYLERFEFRSAQLEALGYSGIAPDFSRRCVTLGRAVRVSGSEVFTGTAESVDDTGALIVRLQDGTAKRVLAGDVSVRGVMGYV